MLCRSRQLCLGAECGACRLCRQVMSSCMPTGKCDGWLGWVGDRATKGLDGRLRVLASLGGQRGSVAGGEGRGLREMRGKVEDGESGGRTRRRGLEGYRR